MLVKSTNYILAYGIIKIGVVLLKQSKEHQKEVGLAYSVFLFILETEDNIDGFTNQNNNADDFLNRISGLITKEAFDE